MTKPAVIYLDYASATPVDEVVLSVMLPYFSDRYYNPSANNIYSRRVASDINLARAKVAHYIGAKPSEIIFTAGASEANNLAIKGIMEQYPKSNLLISAIEHESVIKPSKNYNYKTIKVDQFGRVDLNDLKNQLDDKTVLISVILASNEIGTVQSLKEIRKVINQHLKSRSNQLPLYLHTDATQAVNYLDIHSSRLGIDLMTINGGKIYGPKQSGALFIASKVLIKPLIEGGGQERGIRSGTENVAGIIGLSKALELAQNSKNNESIRLNQLKNYLLTELNQQFPNLIQNGAKNHALPNILNLTLPGVDNERLLFSLDEKAIIAATGSACSASNQTPSHVLKAIGLSNALAKNTIRLSLGRYTTKAQLDQLIKVLKQIA